MKRLNNFVPKNTEIYTIRATGCDMARGKGDGVVLAKNVPLEYAKNYEIKGECTDVLNSNLHTKMIDPELYPHTFEILKAIVES